MKDIDWDELTFSLTPTDWMYVTEVNAGEPWMPGTLTPYADFSISPAAGVLNYGQGLFEGMKAYKDENGKVWLFRPLENFKRLHFALTLYGEKMILIYFLGSLPAIKPVNYALLVSDKIRLILPILTMFAMPTSAGWKPCSKTKPTEGKLTSSGRTNLFAYGLG